MRTTLIGGAVLAGALLLAGCTGSPNDSGSAAPPGSSGPAARAAADPAVRWAGTLCDAVTPAGTLGTQLSGLDGTRPDGLVRMLDTAVTALTASTTALGGVRTAPIAGADAVVGDVTRALGTAATDVTAARAKVAAGDESAVPGAFTTLTSGLDSLTRITDAPPGSPLAAAAAEAPSCRALTGGG